MPSGLASAPPRVRAKTLLFLPAKNHLSSIGTDENLQQISDLTSCCVVLDSKAEALVTIVIGDGYKYKLDRRSRCTVRCKFSLLLMSLVMRQISAKPAITVDT